MCASPRIAPTCSAQHEETKTKASENLPAASQNIQGWSEQYNVLSMTLGETFWVRDWRGKSLFDPQRGLENHDPLKSPSRSTTIA